MLVASVLAFGRSMIKSIRNQTEGRRQRAALPLLIIVCRWVQAARATTNEECG